MLENILSEINESLKRIANSMEKENAKTTKKKKSEAVETVNKTVNDRVNEPMQAPTEEPVQNTLNVLRQVAAADVAPVVPINTAPVTYTQEEIARAMSSAMDAGRSDVVFNILKAFNTNSLMGINQNQYGDVARMLREAGIKI